MAITDAVDSAPANIHDEMDVGTDHRQLELDAEPEATAEPEDKGDDKAKDEKAAEPAAKKDEPADDKAKAEKPAMVPHSRFNEVNEQLKAEREARQAAERRAQELEQQKAKPADEKPKTDEPAFDLKAKLKERNDALIDGDSDKAAEIDAEIMAQQQAQAEERALARLEKKQKEQREADAAKALQDEQERTRALGVELVAKYPQLDDETGDPDLIDLVVAKHTRYMKDMPMDKALQKAVDEVMAKFGGATDAKDEPKDEKLTNVRELNSKVKAADAANKQPPAPVAGMGNRSDIGDKTVLTENLDDDWDKLPEAERRRLLGG